MKKSSKAMLMAAAAAAVALIIGTGVAMAQQATTTTESTAALDAGAGPGMPGMGRPGPGRHLMAGEVTKVEGNTITLKTLKGEEKSVKVDDATIYRKPPDGQATLADVKVGEKIAVRLGQVTDGADLLAKAVIIGEPPARGTAVVGDVVAVNGDTLTIKTASGEEKQVQLPAITQGNRVGVMLGPDGSVKGVMYNPPVRPDGAPDDQAPIDDGTAPPAAGAGA